MGLTPSQRTDLILTNLVNFNIMERRFVAQKPLATFSARTFQKTNMLVKSIIDC